jgi:L-malate glycosyltransferase
MISKIRILFVIDRLGIAGTEKQLVEIIRRLDCRTIEIFLCCLSGPRSRISLYPDIINKSNIIIYDVKSIFSLSALEALYRLVRLIRTEKIDMVQGYFLKSRFLGVVAGRLTGTKTISSMRDLGLSIDYKSLLPTKWANQWSWRFLANSLSIRKYLINEHNIDPRRIDVIRNGVDMRHFQPPTVNERNENKKRLGWDAESLVIGVVANLKPIKGLGDFIRAAAEVCLHNQKARFVIVGEGPDDEALKRLAMGLGIRDKVLFYGGTSDVKVVLEALDIGVLCSLSEGFSNSILEYMAVGLPVVATNVGGNVEQVQDGSTGFLVPPGAPDALAKSIARLADDIKLRIRMGENALRYCQMYFSMENMIKKLEEYYIAIASGTWDLNQV